MGADLCLVIFAAFFVFDSFAGSAAAVGVGTVFDAAGDAEGAGVGVVAVLGGGLVFGASSASTAPAGKYTNTAAAAATTQDSVFI